PSHSTPAAVAAPLRSLSPTRSPAHPLPAPRCPPAAQTPLPATPLRRPHTPPRHSPARCSVAPHSPNSAVALQTAPATTPPFAPPSRPPRSPAPPAPHRQNTPPNS